MSLTAISIGVTALLVACTSSKTSNDSSDTGDNQTAQDLSQNQNAVQQFLDSYNNDSYWPLSITGDTETGYQLASQGLTYSGFVANNFQKFIIDSDSIYNNEGWDGPYVRQGGQTESSLLWDPGTGYASAELKHLQLTSNGEGEKDGVLEDFDDAFSLGSVYFTFSSVESSEDLACYPASPVRYTSELSQELPWFAQLASLTDQTSAVQNTAAVSNTSWLPNGRDIDQSGLDRVYVRNIAGPFFSVGQDNPYKAEFGALGAYNQYSETHLAELASDFVSETEPSCVRFWESDGSLLGATNFIQASFSFYQILETLEDEGQSSQFDLQIFHKLDDEKSIYYGLCQNGQPLSDVISIPSNPDESAWQAAGHSQIDISSLSCDRSWEEQGMAFLAAAEISIQKN